MKLGLELGGSFLAGMGTVLVLIATVGKWWIKRKLRQSLFGSQ